MAHALLLAARQLSRVLARLFRDAHTCEHGHRLLLGLRLLQLAHVARRERDVVEHGQVREQVELLEHHPGLTAHLLDVADVARELDPVDDDPSAVVLLEPVDAADHRRLPRARRPDHDHDLLARDAQVDVVQRLEVTEELVHAFHLDDHVTCDLRRIGEHLSRQLIVHLTPTPSRRSSRWLSRLIVYETVQNMSAANASVSPYRPCPRNCSCCVMA